jgi:hypothetical protein
MATPDRFQSLATLIDRSPRAGFARGVAEEVIADAEHHLGLSFPPSYRWWLRNYGGGYLNGYALQGLFPEMIDAREPGEPLTGDVVHLATPNAQAPAHPKHLLEILSVEGDEVFFLDTARPSPDGEYPVVCRHAGAPGVQDVAPDFATFLERELQA